MANRLQEFDDMLLDLCRVSLQTPDEGPAGPACRQLIRDVISHGRKRFVRQQTSTPGPHEYPLNGAGLKLHYEVECYRDGEDSHVYVANVRIEGSQVSDYPKFVRAAQPILAGAEAHRARVSA